jgi:CzcA family heavy metal efflux pump
VKITDLAIRKSMTSIALMIVVISLGIASYASLPRESAPDVKIPFVMVYAPYYGTSPEDMESLVTRKLENQFKALPDLEEMTSSSSEGVTTVLLEFKPDIEMSDALQNVRDGAELAKPELPQDVRDDMVIYEISSDDWPIMQVVLSGPADLTQLKRIGEDVQEELEQIKGVLAVDMTGGVDREIRVDVDPQRLRYYELALQDVIDAIALENVTLPGGEIALGTYEYQVRVPGEFEAVSDISDLVLNPAGDSPVYLHDVAEVTFGLKDRDSISRLGGRECVNLTVKKRSGENIIGIADKVKAALAELEPTLPPGTEIAIMVDQSEVIRDMVRELENNILSGLLLVIAVLFLFLGLTNSLFVGVAIPFSMLLSFIVLSALSLTLNMVVLFSLILALGMLVDNAIVIVENIYRHRTEGAGQIEAAREGTAEVGSAVVASTLTTLCAFGPLVFWPGIMGEFMKYLPITLIITLTASLLVALVFNPVLCARFMRVRVRQPGQKPPLGDRLMEIGLRSYEPLLMWALHHRRLMFVGLVLLFGVVFGLFGRLNAGVELFPDVEPTYAFVQIEAPSGTRIEQSDSYARQVEAEMVDVPDLHAFVTEVGAGGDAMFGGSQSAPPHLSRLTMEFVKQQERSQSSAVGLEQLRARLTGFTGAKLIIEKQEEGPPTGAPVNIEVHGDDYALLGDLAQRIRDRILGIEGLVDLNDNFDRGRPEIRIRPDLDRAARYGLRTMDVASTVSTAIKGDHVSDLRVGEDEYDIVVRFAQPSRRDADSLEELTVFYEGEQIPLSSFASIDFGSGIGAITRIDGERVVTVTAEAAAGYNGNALLSLVQEDLARMQLPPGYSITFTGESEDQEEASAFLERAFVIALMLILVVLITQFDSVTVPFVIMSSVIMSLIGVFMGLMIMRMPFGIIMTGVGVISLAGIVVNNAIVLLDYIIRLRRAGHEKFEAIVLAGKTRFRPVVLTAVTTILGLIPLTTGFSVDFGRLFSGQFSRVVIIGGESSQWWGPMGVAVIWGLAIATFLTLVMVPVMYSTIDPVLRLLFGRWMSYDPASREAAVRGRLEPVRTTPPSAGPAQTS